MEPSSARFLPIQPTRVGLLAGAGRFPVVFAEAARRQGHAVCCVGIDGLVPDELAGACARFATVPLGRLGKAIRLFRQMGVERAVMAGKIEKRVLFQPYRWLQLLPDLRALHMWFWYATRDKKDDTLLTAVIHEFERDGIRFGSALEYCPEILAKRGFLTRRKPTPVQWKDIHFGWALAKEMGRLDVGQSVIVKDTAVLAVEAIEGTDQAIARAGELCRAGGFTVVKVAKPQQDMRFDVPTIGPQTIHVMHQSGGKVLAIESDRTIVLDGAEVTRLANRWGIAIVALNEGELQQRLSA